MYKLLAIGGPPCWASGRWQRLPTRPQGRSQRSTTRRGVYFTASLSNTVGVKLSQLKDGDRVTVVYTDDPAEQKWPINVMELKKAN
jgi:hypothetical protein